MLGSCVRVHGTYPVVARRMVRVLCVSLRDCWRCSSVQRCALGEPLAGCVVGGWAVAERPRPRAAPGRCPHSKCCGVPSIGENCTATRPSRGARRSRTYARIADSTEAVGVQLDLTPASRPGPPHRDHVGALLVLRLPCSVRTVTVARTALAPQRPPRKYCLHLSHLDTDAQPPITLTSETSSGTSTRFVLTPQTARTLGSAVSRSRRPGDENEAAIVMPGLRRGTGAGRPTV